MGKILRLNTESLEFEELNTSDIIVGYRELMEAVGGYFERVTFNKRLCENNIDVFVNEEGKLINLDLSVVVVNQNNVVETLAGDIVFAGRRNNETLPLTENQIEIIKEELERKINITYLKNDSKERHKKVVRILNFGWKS